jgi:hypothetical protein
MTIINSNYNIFRSLIPFFLVFNLFVTAKPDRILEPGNDEMEIYIGPFGGINYNIHSGEFVTTEGKLECCTFDNGSGIKPVVGIKAFIPIFQHFTFSPRLAYEGRGGSFDKPQKTLPILGEDNQTEWWTFSSKLDVTLNTFDIDLFASYYYDFSNLRLYGVVGPSLAFLFSRNFSATESIVSPSGVKYLDGTTSHKVFDSDTLDIVNTSIIQLRIGAGASFNVWNNFYLNPEILYGLPLNKISKEKDWKAGSVQFTIGILYKF